MPNQTPSLPPDAPLVAPPRKHARFPANAVPLVALGLLGLGGCVMMTSLAKAPPSQTTISTFSTTLKGRSRGQRRNAELAARSLDGRVIAPGAVFSFNQTVRSWSVDQGYVKALVSYDGELVRAYGGGVCQTSTTLYNAALLAGLPILERHPHVFVPHYIAPGRDAAVAFPGIDLRFRNFNPFPIRLHARVRGEQLEVSLSGARAPKERVSIRSETLSVSTPLRLTHVSRRRTEGTSTRRSFLRSVGTTGYRVLTFRVFSSGKRESLGDDSYPAMNRIVALNRD